MHGEAYLEEGLRKLDEFINKISESTDNANDTPMNSPRSANTANTNVSETIVADNENTDLDQDKKVFDGFFNENC